MGMEDLIRQMPPGLILMTCGSGVLLVVLWGIIFWRRGQRKARQRAAEQTPSPATTQSPSQEVPSRAEQRAAGALSSIGRSIRNFFFYTEEEKAAMEKKQPMQPHKPAPGNPTPDVAAPPDTVEVMRVWRDVIDGSLVVQIGGQRFRTIGELRAADQERRFMAVLRELALLARESESAPPPARPEPAQTDGPEAAPQEPLPEPDLTVEQPLPADPPPKATPPPPAAPSTAPQTPPPPPRAYSTMPEPEPLGSFFDNVKKAIQTRGKTPGPAPEPPSIAEQIEAHLQYRIATTPQFQGRSFHIHAAPYGGVRIEIDGLFYEAVSDINDDAVREFILTVIREWEEQ